MTPSTDTTPQPVPPPLPPASSPATTPASSPGEQMPSFPQAATQHLPTTPPDRRRPGWLGVVAVGAGAAVLSSALTAGLITMNQNSSTASSEPASAGSTTQSAPAVVTDTAAQPNWVSVASAVEPSVVSVQLSAQQRGLGEGSGVVWDAEGRIVTNNHVVEAAAQGAQVTVVLSDGRNYSASLVGTDPSTDLAVIKIDSPPDDLTPATFGDSGAVQVGEPVMALGNPLGLSDTVTTGIVSALDRPVSTGTGGNAFGQAQEPVVTNAIQTDAAVNPGNSGGALVDGQGRVIGITSSIASLGSSMGGQSGSIGLGFAIPANEVKAIADELITTGSVKHAFLGVGLGDGVTSVDGAQRRAAVIASVTEGTAAAEAGLQRGDAVIAMNDKPLDGAESLIAQVRAARPGTDVVLSVVRDGTAQDITVTLGVRPTS